MRDDRVLLILRDNEREPGCIEYSWVPSGQREHIMLTPGQQQATRTSKIDKATNLQVYVLTQGRQSFAMWLIPDRGERQILSAVIAVKAAANTVEGVVFYADGTHSVHKHALENEPRRCPTGMD